MERSVFSLLKQSSLMAGVDDALIEKIATTGRSRVIKGRNGRIDSEELSRRLFLVVSGEFRVLRISAEGQECLMQRVMPGEFFCLASLISGRNCGSQLVSHGVTELFHWKHEQFQSHLSESDVLRNNLLQQMACQVEEERDMRTLSRCCKADVRVAAYLLHKMKSRPRCKDCKCNSIDLKPIAFTAQELGIARETLTRSLQRLDKKQCISYQRGLVQIDHLNKLETILEESDCSCEVGH